MTRRKRSSAALLAAFFMLAACGRQIPAPEYSVREYKTLDGEAVSSWMMGTNCPYPAEVDVAPAVPSGYVPVYLSHYGRHGSRYLTEPDAYDKVHEVLLQAAEAGKLTGLGGEVYKRYEEVYPHFSGREGELTMVGARQHELIAWRMVQRWPALFSEGARVEANSTNLERTMLSMQYFTQELRALCPGLELHADASKTLMGNINQHSPQNPKVIPADVRWKSPDAPWRVDFWKHFRKAIDWEPFSSRLFTDLAWLRSVLDPFDFGMAFYDVAMNLPNCPLDTGGLFDVFTAGELSLLAQMGNYSFYAEKSLWSGGNGRGCYLSESLLSDLLFSALEDMDKGVKVRLRFGHDGCMMALFALLRLPGWDALPDDPAEAWKYWDVSRIPMAANFQMVVFAPNRPSVGPEELIFTFLLNEEPMAFPLKDLGGRFYSFKDLLDYCAPIIAEARARLG